MQLKLFEHLLPKHVYEARFFFCSRNAYFHRLWNLKTKKITRQKVHVLVGSLNKISFQIAKCFDGRSQALSEGQAALHTVPPLSSSRQPPASVFPLPATGGRCRFCCSVPRPLGTGPGCPPGPPRPGACGSRRPWSGRPSPRCRSFWRWSPGRGRSGRRPGPGGGRRAGPHPTAFLGRRVRGGAAATFIRLKSRQVVVVVSEKSKSAFPTATAGTRGFWFLLWAAEPFQQPFFQVVLETSAQSWLIWGENLQQSTNTRCCVRFNW